MEFVLTNKQKINQFSLIFKNLKNISSEVEMHIQEHRIYIQGMDSGQVCLFEIELKSFWFNEYKFGGKNLRLGINCELIHKIINCKEDSQNIRFIANDIDKLNITLYPCEGQTGITKEFELTLVDIDTQLLVVPVVDYDADIEILSTDVANIISQLSLFGKNLNVNCGEKIIFKGSGELGTMSAIIEEEQICMYAIAEDTNINLSFNMDYLVKMVSFSKLNVITKIHFGIDYPMKLQYDLDFALDDDGDDNDDDDEVQNYIRFFLAPKIEDF
jgi:proliferating cell nuclear antigen PCNA